MTDRKAAAPPPKRPFWGRYRLLAAVGAGVVAVVLIATTHPWIPSGPAPPTFVLKGMTITFAGTGATGVKSELVCAGVCPVSAPVGSFPRVPFSVSPTSTSTGNCSPTTYYSITAVSVVSPVAFTLHALSVNSGGALPVTLPDPYGGTTCVETVEIWVTFSVADVGPANQTPTLKVSVTKD